MPTPEELASEQYQASVVKAEEAMRTNAMVISGNRLSPRIVWTLRPRTEPELRRMVEAEGMSPFRFLKAMTLGREAISWPGAPYWAQCAYLVMVEVKALIVE